MPALPQCRELMAQLAPIHATLAHQSSNARRHPVYKCNEVQVSSLPMHCTSNSTKMKLLNPIIWLTVSQAEAATKFLRVMRDYMESLCSDLHSHTITSVQSNSDRVLTYIATLLEAEQELLYFYLSPTI